MTIAELLEATRDLLRDTARPYLWSDNTIVMYLNDGLEDYVERTHTYVTATEEITLYENEDTYDLPDNTVKIYRIKLDGFVTNLGASTDAWTPVDGAVGTPVRYTTDTATGTIKFWPCPDTTYTATLRLAKTPETFSLDNDSVTLPYGYSVMIALMDYAAFRCFSHDDADGRNQDAAERAKKRFDAAVNSEKASQYKLNVGSATRVNGNRIR